MKIDKNIGLVTYYKENYGSILQCYATKFFLENMGYKCHVLYQRYDSGQYRMLRIKNAMYHAYKSLRYRGYFSKYVTMRRAMQNEKGYLTHCAYERQNEFIDEVLKPEGYTWKELCKLANMEEYIAFIAGSDQIWNASIHIDSIYFLRFVPKKKRIALAPSFGISSIPDYNRKSVQDGLEGFTRIAVREKTGRMIIEQYCEIPTIQIADPVFLLSMEQWIQFSESENAPTMPYIFVHFLNRPKEQTITEIEKLSKKLGIQVVCFSYSYLEYNKFENAIHIDGTPKEFVALIRNARYVCTDSFHSTVFSIMLHTEFYTFPRQHLHTASQSSRITDLLERFGLDRKYVKYQKISDESLIDWNVVDEIIEKDRVVLKKYLEEEIKRGLNEGICI